tara:strand:+ start:2453 stop:2746 length:294 start_codon:yes stop_codon:yes gene_type:complete
MFYNKELMTSQLQQGVCEVFFKKRNNAIRQMICTLNPTQLPLTEMAQSLAVAPQQNPTPAQQNLISVWDLEKMAWRSFRVNSVLFFRVKGQPPQNVK